MTDTFQELAKKHQTKMILRDYMLGLDRLDEQYITRLLSRVTKKELLDLARGLPK